MYAILSNTYSQPTSKQKLMTMFELTENDKFCLKYIAMHVEHLSRIHFYNFQ
jgi:hypothetical protein